MSKLKFFIKSFIRDDKKAAKTVLKAMDKFRETFRAAINLFEKDGNRQEVRIMKEDTKLLEDVRNIFKEELAKASENFAAQQRTAAENTETKFSIKSDNDIEKFKKMSYNQYRSERLAFENDSSPAGTQRMLYNPQMKQYEVWEKGDDVLLITGIAKSSGEAEKLYEQTYRTTVDTVYECTESFKNAKGKDTWDSQFLKNRGNGFRNSSESESKRFQSISAGSRSNLSESDNGESINNEPSSKDGGFSMPKFSIDDEAYMQAVNSGDTEAAQRMVDEAAEKMMPDSKIRDENGKLLIVYHGTSEKFTVFDKTKGRSTADIQGMFFRPWEIEAGGYGKNIGAYYLNVTNPANESTAYKALRRFQGQNYAGTKAREYLESLGYDGVDNEYDEYIAFNPSQIKSADPITYDDNGNVIPLSERFNENNPDIRFSFAGESSEFADSTALDTAKQMLADGVNSEKVRKQTGWFKSYDGKWRYEIDDSKMHINSMEYRNGGNYTTVGRLIEHSDLFDAYPFLADMPLFFVDIGNGKGTYSQTFGMIKLDRSLKNNIDGFRTVVIHELQHAIQDYESFAGGSSADYWQRMIDDGYDSRPDKTKREEAELYKEYRNFEKNNPEMFSDVIQLLKNEPTVPRGKFDFETFQQIEEDPPEWQRFDKQRDNLVEKYGHDVYHLISLENNLIRIKSKNTRNAYELYLDTAGEIEARDTSSRFNMTAEQRRNTRPDIDRTGVVFAENSDSYSLTKSKIERLTSQLKELGQKRIRLMAGDKPITVRTDNYTADKNIFSEKGRTSKEINARIKAIPSFENIIKTSKYNYTDTNVSISNSAKKGVKGIHHFLNNYNDFDVDILIRDKGDRQYLYEVKFIDNKKSPQQSMKANAFSPAAEADVENDIDVTTSSAGSQADIENNPQSENSYSINEDSGMDSLYADVIRENQNLRWIFSQYDDIYSSRRFDISLKQEDIDRVARVTLNKYGSKYDVKTLSDRLTAVYDYLGQTAAHGQIDNDTVYNRLFAIAKDILLLFITAKHRAQHRLFSCFVCS